MIKWILIWGIVTCLLSLIYALFGLIPFSVNLPYAAAVALIPVFAGIMASNAQKRRNAQQAPLSSPTVPLKNNTLTLTEEPDGNQTLLPNGLAVPPPSLFLPETDQLYETEAQPNRLIISYKDNNTPTERTSSIIHPINVTYFVRGNSLIITELTAFDETENDTNSFTYRDILSATDTRTNQPISNLGITLLGKDFHHDKDALS